MKGERASTQERERRQKLSRIIKNDSEVRVEECYLKEDEQVSEKYKQVGQKMENLQGIIKQQISRQDEFTLYGTSEMRQKMRKIYLEEMKILRLIEQEQEDFDKNEDIKEIKQKKDTSKIESDYFEGLHNQYKADFAQKNHYMKQSILLRNELARVLANKRKQFSETQTIKIFLEEHFSPQQFNFLKNLRKNLSQRTQRTTSNQKSRSLLSMSKTTYIDSNPKKVTFEKKKATTEVSPLVNRGSENSRFKIGSSRRMMRSISDLMKDTSNFKQESEKRMTQNSSYHSYKTKSPQKYSNPFLTKQYSSAGKSHFQQNENSSYQENSIQVTKNESNQMEFNQSNWQQDMNILAFRNQESTLESNVEQENNYLVTEENQHENEMKIIQRQLEDTKKSIEETQKQIGEKKIILQKRMQQLIGVEKLIRSCLCDNGSYSWVGDRVYDVFDKKILYIQEKSKILLENKIDLSFYCNREKQLIINKLSEWKLKNPYSRNNKSESVQIPIRNRKGIKKIDYTIE